MGQEWLMNETEALVLEDSERARTGWGAPEEQRTAGSRGLDQQSRGDLGVGRAASLGRVSPTQ